MKKLSYYHPFSIFAYFISVFVFSVISRNPVYLIISFTGAIVYCGFLFGLRGMLSELKKITPFMLVVTGINPLISRYGGTPLFFINDSPYTLEALVYGIFLSVMLAAVLIWGKCFNQINDSEKTLYIASHFSETISVILSMSLRFIPMLKVKHSEIKSVRKTMRLYYCDNLYEKIRSQLVIMSVLLTWAIENSVDTAASMKARGFGTGKRSSYSVYKIRKRDAVLIIFSLLFTVVIVSVNKKAAEYAYYPFLSQINTDKLSGMVFVMSSVFVLIPAVIELRSRIIWKRLK